MGPHLLGRSSLLLLLLGMWWSVCPLCAVPKGLTKARWFEIQHIQPRLLQCNTAMRGVNNYTRHCKPENTFLHNFFQDVTAVCNLPNIICKNGRHNCHQSPKPVNLTQCNLIAGRYPDCRYHDDAQYKFFIVACDPPQKTDPPYHLVPVHLDKDVAVVEQEEAVSGGVPGGRSRCCAAPGSWEAGSREAPTAFSTGCPRQRMHGCQRQKCCEEEVL